MSYAANRPKQFEFHMYCTLCGFVADYLMICSIISEPGGGSSCSKNEQSQCLSYLICSNHIRAGRGSSCSSNEQFQQCLSHILLVRTALPEVAILEASLRRGPGGGKREIVLKKKSVYI